MNAMPTALGCLLLALPLAAAAHGDSHAKADASISTDKHAWGQQGDPKQATRTIKVSMSDKMRFTPDRFHFKKGETVTFEVRNDGRLMHEFVLGTEAELVKHAELMRKFPAMEHDAPYMAHVKPKSTQRITWRFTEGGSFLAGCLIAGHWDAGMKANILIKE